MTGRDGELVLSEEVFAKVAEMLILISDVSSGDYSTRLHLDLPPEHPLGALAVGLNEMVDALAAAQAGNKAFQREIEDKLATIERQQLAIHELSTPVIDIWDGILTLPIVGAVDSRRAADMTERLLRRIVESESRCVIIDLTGVEVLDTKTADHIVKMTQAVRLIGSWPVVTGIGADIATTLVDLGVDLMQLRTVRTLKEGLKTCFRYLDALDRTRATPVNKPRSS